MFGTPLELSKLCCNVIVKEFYHENENIFKKDIFELKLPDDINKLIIERYELIKHIVKHDGIY